MKNFRSLAIEAALKSGALIKSSVGKISDISYKGRDNIVTDVDKRSEKLIVRTILRSYSGHAILAEEGSSSGNISDYKWIIDPLDGTTNFAHAFPFFCVSIALEHKDDIILGVVYDPMRGELFYAEKGRGAFLNKKRIRVSNVKTLANSFLSTGFSYGITRKDRNIRYFKNILPNCMAIRRAGAAALDMCYVACGRFDGFWEMNLKPWDSAAGMLIVFEAGGIVTRLDGTRFTPYNKDVLADNRLIHRRIKNFLKK